MIEALFVVALIAAAYGLGRRRGGAGKRRKTRQDPAFLRRRRGKKAEAELLHMTGNDKAKVERLIDFERQRNPNGDREKWAIAAHKRWLAALR